MKLLRLDLGLACALLISAIGCSEDGGDECPTGSEGCACTAELACNAGLTCDGAMCVGAAGVGGSAVAVGGSSSGGSSSGGAASGGASSGGAASGGAASGGAASGGAASGGDAGVGGGADTGGAEGVGGGTDTGGSDGAGGTDGGEFTLTSNELMEGMPYPDAHTCASGQGLPGEPPFGLPPSLQWSGAPEGTMSYALTMIDVTLADGGGANPHLGCHSAFWNLPASVTSLPVNDWSAEITGMDNIRGGYLGPCPGGNTDTYEITLYAMGDATIASPGDMTNIDNCNMLRDTLDNSSLGKVVLTGTSDAQ